MMLPYQLFFVCLIALFPNILNGWKAPVLSLLQMKVSETPQMNELLKVSGSNNFRYSWPLAKVAFSLLPLYPSEYRKTILEVIIPNKIWTFDQLQGIFNVNVPVRSVVIKLKEGGLFIYNPVAPTIEFVEMIKNLEKKHGKVRYVVLGTVGLEHKVFVGAFANYFPTAIVYVQPGQWSFPVNLPNLFLGFPWGNRLREIPMNKSLAPWMNDFDYSILGPLRFKSVGGFSETVFYHKETKTLLVTDILIKVSERLPPIIEDDPRALLYHSRDTMLDDVQDTPANRLKGWKRMVLFSLTFVPSGITIPNPFQTLLNLFKVSKEATQLGNGVIPLSGGLYPWEWKQSEEKSFQSLQGGILVAPILSEIIFNREASRVYQWAEHIASNWLIQRIIPSHLENNIIATNAEFLKAFSVLQPSMSTFTITSKPKDRSSTTKSKLLSPSLSVRTTTTPDLQATNLQTYFAKFFRVSASTTTVDPVASPRVLPEDLSFLRTLSNIFEKYQIN